MEAKHMKMKAKLNLDRESSESPSISENITHQCLKLRQRTTQIKQTIAKLHKDLLGKYFEKKQDTELKQNDHNNMHEGLLPFTESSLKAISEDLNLSWDSLKSLEKSLILPELKKKLKNVPEKMTFEEAEYHLKKHWDTSGACASCGWHALLSEYDLESDLEVNLGQKRLHLPCLSKNEDGSSHRGVIIYY